MDSDREFTRAGIWNWEKPDITDELHYAQYAEEAGLDSVWQGESRLVRDAMTVMGAYTQVTDEIDIAPGVTNCYTRNVALMAQTFSTLHELSGGRTKLGIGAWWDPLASKVGIDRGNPLRHMWEYCTVTRKLLDLENVTYDGDEIQVEDIELDLVRADAEPRDVPIYIGATGETMHQMTGELVGKGIVDGIFMNYFIPPEHVERGLERLEAGVEKQGGSMADVDRPQLIAVSMDEDVDVALDEARGLATQYIGQQPHITKASGISDANAERVEAELDWPATAADIERASEHVPDEVVRNIVATGTREDVIERLGDYCEAGCTEPVVYPLTDNMEDVIDTVAAAKAEGV
ncbi:alkanesulfonate monooxygenase SsuD/methylene tetrahydromethanopterin reductase-like flavin-dependent oxidoreductase (luciferase family) [Halarchaeum solikamskense]|uniref:LLM class flavin-dependent oxidoreductase n=1 Tax=Halarchaeum nitratireducens TaxID=489913 RepID=UPI001B3AAC58|nr:LLM class flavin-dependent oxidoreductase [Halarchaeum solikamskense]MBP2252453.1 alkanesulfonate monooxygenase SsuD/methylene tetrahydromethanopterin reductase-like flavin-dependent oxidoreductase (luciferase family) [Halarchaeum solikamskense]